MSVLVDLNQQRVGIAFKGAFAKDLPSMDKLTSEETMREHNRGRKAVGEGRSRYWSEPWAYPFESEEHYELRRQAFEQGYGQLNLRHHADTP